MKSITLRDLPPDLSQRIEERSRQTGASLSKTVREMLAEAEPVTKGRLHHDLDHLAGSWTEEESGAFDSQTAAQRVVDPELWQ